MNPMQDLVANLSEGNPGAITVLMKVAIVRPDLLLYMRDNGPKGADIWVLYKDECDEDIFLFMDTLDLRDSIDKMEAADV